MASIKRAVTNSLEAVRNEQTQARRRAEIAEVPNPLKRAGLLAVQAVVNRYADALIGRFGLPPDDSELPYLDHGVQSRVYRISDDTVLKIVHDLDATNRPIQISARQRRERAAAMKEQHAAMAFYLGEIVLPHDIFVGPHPLDRDSEAIQILQPYRELEFLQLSDNQPTTAALKGRLYEAELLHPGLVRGLNAILEGSHQLDTNCGLVTDVVGRNVGFDPVRQTVAIVDSQPVPPERVTDQALARRHITRLDTVINELAVAA